MRAVTIFSVAGDAFAHRDELQDRIGRRVDVEGHVRMARDQADGVALEMPDHGVITVAFAEEAARTGSVM